MLQYSPSALENINNNSSMLTNMLVQPTVPRLAGLSPPSGRQRRRLQSLLLKKYCCTLRACADVRARVCVYLTQSHQSRDPDRQKQQRALGVPCGHPTYHDSLNDLNKSLNRIDARPKMWHAWAEQQYNLPSGRYQNKPSGNRSVLAATWRIPERWWRTSPEKCLRRNNKKNTF